MLSGRSTLAAPARRSSATAQRLAQQCSRLGRGAVRGAIGDFSWPPAPGPVTSPEGASRTESQFLRTQLRVRGSMGCHRTREIAWRAAGRRRGGGRPQMPRLGLATEQDWANLNTSDDSAICALGDRVLFDVVVPRIPSRPITSGGPRRELRPLRRPLRRPLASQVVARIPPGARHAVAAHASCRRGRAYHQRRRAGMHSRPLVGWPCYEPTARAQASAREGGETPTSARPAAARQRAARTASGASGATGHTCCNLL